MTSLDNKIDVVLSAGNRLLTLPQSAEKLASLPIPHPDEANPDGDSENKEGFCWISLPEWAADILPAHQPGLFVPKQGSITSWKDYNWWAGAYDLLTSQGERHFELAHGPIHSYSFRLPDKNSRAFDYAWFNRILLFLRRWWSHLNQASEIDHFGTIPKAVIHLTHDVDATKKTLAIRFKQGVFCLYNKRFKQAFRFLFRGGNYWQFDNISELEKKHNMRSVWHFYAGKGGLWRSLKEQLFDPAYDIHDKRLSAQILKLQSQGHEIGLHPKFDSWCDAGALQIEKKSLESLLKRPVTSIRQHWLRFSFEATWASQKTANLAHDTTLAFNDRWGFRNSSAVRFTEPVTGMTVTPTVLMDSHLYDYNTLNASERYKMIDMILDELVATGGEVSVVWHQRVYHADYSWYDSYSYLLEQMQLRQILPAIGQS